MRGERYVVLGLAHARAEWFRAVGQWAHQASLPLEFVKVVSAAELRTRLTSGRPFSAVLVDAGHPGLDRDLVDSARDTGCPTLVVADGRVVRDWTSLGVSAVLPFNLTRDDLLETLAAHALPVGQRDVLPHEGDADSAPPWRGRVVAVCGPGGTGASTVAIALAQGLAADARDPKSVVLADLKLHAEQAMLHDAGDVVPGVQELVDAHRAGRPTLDEVRAMTFRVHERRYSLLLGLRRARFWSTLRPRAFEAALTSLARAYEVVACDVDADLEGEEDGGSVDVGERNVMARTATAQADVVFAVGLPTMKGLHSLVRVVHGIFDLGVEPERVVPVLNRSPRAPRARAQLAEAVAELLGPAVARGIPSPLCLPERRVEEALRDGVRLPSQLADPLAAAFLGVCGRVPQPTAPRTHEAVRIRPGELGEAAVL